MAKYRYVYGTFWSDPEIQNLLPDEKLFYIYLLTNPHTSICGIYTLSIPYIEIETGIKREKIKTLIDRFEKMGKIKYSHKTSEFAIKNWKKYNLNCSSKIIKAAESVDSNLAT